MEWKEKREAKFNKLAWKAVKGLAKAKDSLSDINGKDTPLMYFEGTDDEGVKHAFIYAVGPASTGIYDLGESLVKQPQDLANE